MTNRLTLRERQEQVQDLLQPDEIRQHRVSRGLEITEEQAFDLVEKGNTAALFARGMSEISQKALDKNALDPTSKTIRSLLGTESIFQALRRGDISSIDLPEAEITKVDLVMTDNGFSIVEIEPGKIRGIGYGRMVREQASTTVGVSAEQGLAPIINQSDTMIALSDYDRFHIPELNILGRFVSRLSVVNQSELLSATTPQAILASRLKGSEGKQIEEKLRQDFTIVSDRRPDLESKGVLALAHNMCGDQDLEMRLLNAFSEQGLNRIREASPKTFHTLLMTPSERELLREAALNGRIQLFAKPMSDAGTRGMVTPSDTQTLADLIMQKQAKSYVFQVAEKTVFHPMESIDVITGEHSIDEMNIRVTLHVDKHGTIIESSVVGSPHTHLAHGGKTSIITNIEVAHG